MIARPLSIFLTRLIWLCMTPLLLLAIVLSWNNLKTQEQNQLREGGLLTENVASSVDRLLQSRIRALNMLAISPFAGNPRHWRELYGEAQGFKQSFGSHVIFADANRQMIFNTRVPYGTKLSRLPDSKGQTAAPLVLATGQAQVGDIVSGPIAKVQLVAIVVPVLNKGKTTHLLLTTFEAANFQHVFDSLALPTSWSLALKDSTGTVIARRSPPGFDEVHDVEDDHRFIVRSQLSPWSVELEIPRSSYRSTLINSLLFLTATILLATLTGISGGLLASRRIIRQVRMLTVPPESYTSMPAITEIATARAELDAASAAKARSEARYTRLFHEIPVALCNVDRNGVLSDRNTRFDRLFGYDHGELRTLDDWWLLAYPDPNYRAWVLETWNAAVTRAAKTKTDIEPVEYEVCCRGGERRIVLISGITVDEDFLAAFYDITERRQAEIALRDSQVSVLESQRLARLAALNLMEDAVAARIKIEKANAALQESESKYRLVSDNAAECIFWLGTDGRYKYFSPACERIFGHSAADFIADPNLLGNLIHPDDRDTFLKHVKDGQHADETELELRYFDKNGAMHWLSHHCQPMQDDHGKHIGRRGSNREITSRKEAEAMRDLFSEALRQSAHPLVLTDSQARISYVNPAFTSLFGYELNELAGAHISRIVPPFQVYKNEQAEIADQLSKSDMWQGEVDRLASDGTLIPTMANIASIRARSGTFIGYVASYLDLRPLREKEETLRKLSLAVEQSPESIYITDLDGNIEYVNESFAQNTGYDRNEIIGQNPRILHSGKTPNTTYEDLWKSLSAGNTWQGEFYNKRKDGSEYIEHAIINPIRQPDGRITHYVSVQEDITARIQAEAEINRLAFYDTLTGLPNRTLLLERMEQTLAMTRRFGHHSAMLSFNIDRFKTVNDAGGQVLGDALLVAVSERLKATLREGDVVARISGDEFGILLTDLSLEQHSAAHLALNISEKIHASLQLPLHAGDEHLTLSACMGIALFPESDEDSPLDILRRANTALHHAKTRGKGQAAFFEDSLDQIAKQRFDIERELHQAITGNELRVFLQPQVDSAGNIVGAEALVRWQHPQRGLIPPGIFIPIAEESNLIVEIGAWVFFEVCRLLAREDVAALPIRIAVNISPRHFRQAGFVEQIKYGLASTGANAAHLTLEVTEGMVIDNVNDVIAKMAELSVTGIHFSMDDFGTGYSSLSYLKRLPIHELKIDKSFIQDLTIDPEDDALVETILAVAKLLHLKVVAEGVETTEQAAFLNLRGQVIHQGYLFGRPEQAELVIAEIVRKNS